MPYKGDKDKGGSIMKEWYKKRRKSADKSENIENNLEDPNLEPATDEELNEEEEFNSFFAEVLKKFPKKTSAVILKTYDKSKEQAEKILAKTKDQYNSIFDEFLVDVDEETKKRTHSTIHAASLTAAIIGCSPIPFSDAFLLVPIQLTMMARLHKIFDQKFSENLGESLARELVIVGLGRSAVGNLMKFVPAVGTVAGAAVNAVVASTITGALGWVTVKMLNDGEDIFEDVMSFKNQFNVLFNALKSSDKATK